jgi:hypothetical protein
MERSIPVDHVVVAQLRFFGNFSYMYGMYKMYTNITTARGHYSCYLSVSTIATGRQLPPLSSVLYGIISRRRSVLAAQLLLKEKSGA